MSKVKLFFFYTLLCICVFLCLFTACTKTEVTESIAISGRIVEQGTPIEGVEVLVHNHSLANKIISNENGEFKITGLEAGSVLSFSKYGFVINDFRVERSLTDLVISALRNNYAVKVDFDSYKGSVTGGGNYEYEQTATLQATPKQHYKFDGFYIGSEQVSASSSFSFNVEKSTSFYAKFSPVLYNLNLTTNAEQSLISGAGSYALGSDITLVSKDSDDFYFAYWLVDNVKYYDKTHSFVFSNENMQISAFFEKRLTKPSATYCDGIISWQAVADAKKYKLSILDKTLSVDGLETNLKALDLPSGDYTATVVATGCGYADSVPFELKFSYLRPIDFPRESGFIIDEDKIYYSFTKINCAVGYEIKIDEKLYSLGDLTFEERINSIKIDLTLYFIESKNYSVSVRALAKNPLQNSDFTAVSQFTFTPLLEQPTYVVENNILTWSHSISEVEFYLIVDDILLSLEGLTQYDLKGFLGAKDMRLLVKAKGYKDNYIKII